MAVEGLRGWKAARRIRHDTSDLGRSLTVPTAFTAFTAFTAQTYRLYRLRSIFTAVSFRHLAFIMVGAWGAAACGGSPESGRLPDAPRSHGRASVLRLPRDKGAARLYRLPALEPSAWKQSDKLPALATVVGADLEQRLVYALDDKQNLVGLDLDSRR